MRSKNGLIFGVINIIGNFATVFNDQAYYQRAIASKGTTTVKAFLLGGIAWFSIPFMFATTLGLAAVALTGDPSMKKLTPADVSAGLPAPSAATALLGKSGAAIMLVLLFLAVTSATSAELIAVSSILTYDVYKRYFNPRATEHQVLRASQYGILGYAIFMGLAGTVFYYIGVSLGWLYTFMGTLLGSAVVPIALCITWKKANRMGCIAGAVIGLACGLMSWLVATSTLNGGVISVTTSGGDYEMLTGNLVAIAIGGIIAVTASVIWPEDFNFDITRAINTSALEITDGDIPAILSPREDEIKTSENEKATSKEGITMVRDTQVDSLMQEELDPIELRKAFKFAATSSIILTLISIIIIPLPLFFSSTIFGVRGYSAWVTIGIIWVFGAIIAVVFLPLYESREALGQIFRGIIKDIYNPGSGKYIHQRHNTPATTTA